MRCETRCGHGLQSEVNGFWLTMRAARKRLIAAIVLVVIPVVAGWHWRPEPNLAESSRKVCPLYSLVGRGVPCIDPWLLDNASVGAYMPYYFFNEYTGTDRVTGDLRLLPQYAKAPSGGGSPSFTSASAYCLSPDRRWLLATIEYSSEDVEHWYAIRVNGSDVKSWTRPGSSSWFWSASSDGGLLYDYDTHEVQKWSLSMPSGRIGQEHPRANYMVPGWSPVGIVGSGVLAVMEYGDPHERIRFARIEPRSPLREIGSVPTPDHGCCVDVKLSPHGDKLALLVRYDVSAPHSALLRRIYAMLRVRTGSFDRIWICRPDGSGMKPAGYLPTEIPSNGEYISQIGWLRDGKHLWFEYKQALWATRVDAG